MKLYLVVPILFSVGLTSAQMLTPQPGAPIAAAGGVSVSAPQNVAGVPFSADVVTEGTRTLPNGGIVQTKTQGKLYRDSEGRTRRESNVQMLTAAAAGSVPGLVITDPVRQVMIVLDEVKKTATVYPWHSPMANHLSGSSPYNAAAAQTWPSAPSTVPGANTVARPAATATFTPASATSARVTVENLESRELEGVRVTGTRTTRTWLNGAEGKPQVTIIETWTSSDLKLTLLSETTGSHSSKTITKLTNLVRTEPDASLFQIPAEYTVTDTTKR